MSFLFMLIIFMVINVDLQIFCINWFHNNENIAHQCHFSSASVTVIAALFPQSPWHWRASVHRYTLASALDATLIVKAVEMGEISYLDWDHSQISPELEFLHWRRSIHYSLELSDLVLLCESCCTRFSLGDDSA